MDAPRYSSIEDFVFDASFRDWILRNDSTHKIFWEAWMAAHPQQLGVINHAKSIVYALSARHSLLSEHEIEEEIRSILQKAAAEAYPPGIDEKFLFSEPEVATRSVRKKAYLPLWGSIAAAVLLVVGLVFYNRTGTHNTVRETVQVQEGKTPFNASIEKTNRTDSVQIILLPDQSRVELAANSTLAYTAKDFTSKREVHLTGEAFFTVTKMPSSPFMVYTSNMVTKVLGTSFRVTAFPGDKKAFVMVKTGKVSVYKQTAFAASDASSRQLDGVIVVPNQQVVYDVTTRQLTKNIIDKPVLLAKSNNENFVFASTPLKEVFARLEHAYGIQVMYDETMISSCSLSANMGNESFYEKLDLICRTINASYESIDGSIFITSHGCN